MSKQHPYSREAEILLVEDNLDDVELTREGFRGSRLDVNLYHVSNGEECMDFLRKVTPYSEAPTPDIILLDLNMPKMSGHEVMRQIAEDKNLNHIPTIILTSSSDEADILEMYKLRCSSYIVKPVDFNQFSKVVTSITDYWFSLVVLPK